MNSNATTGILGGTSGKEPAYQCRRHVRQGFDLWVGKTPWRRKWQHTPVFLTGETHGQRNLAMDYGPKGHKQLDTTGLTYHCNAMTNQFLKGMNIDVLRSKT